MDSEPSQFIAANIRKARTLHGVAPDQYDTPWRSFSHLLDERARLTPDQAYLIYYDDKTGLRIEYSYADFNRRVNQVANYLRDVLGVKRGDLVTVALQGDLGKPRPALVIQSDLFDAEAPALFRHYVLWVESGDQMNHAALGALAGNEDRSVFATLERGFLEIPAQVRFRALPAVAAVAVLREERLDVFGEVHRASSRGREFGEVHLGGPARAD